MDLQPNIWPHMVPEVCGGHGSPSVNHSPTDILGALRNAFPFFIFLNRNHLAVLGEEDYGLCKGCWYTEHLRECPLWSLMVLIWLCGQGSNSGEGEDTLGSAEGKRDKENQISLHCSGS